MQVCCELVSTWSMFQLSNIMLGCIKLSFLLPSGILLGRIVLTVMLNVSMLTVIDYIEHL